MTGTGWDAFYSSGHLTTPSRFAVWTAARLADIVPRPGTLIDLGCGNGRDTAFFAANGFAAVGVDSSVAGIEAAQREHSEPARYLCGDLTVGATWDELLSAAVGPRVFYGRFLLHALTPAARGSLLTHLARAMRAEDVAVFEFRTPLDAELPKALSHDRWYVDPDELAQQLGLLGLDTCLDECGLGLAPWGSEDPFVARVTVTKTGATPAR